MPSVELVALRIGARGAMGRAIPVDEAGKGPCRWKRIPR
jgi:hypothetical protein